MNNNLSDPTPRPRQAAARPVRRAAPCAGLFGWRKGGALPVAADGPPDERGPGYPAG